MCQNWRCARLPGFLPSLESAHRRWRRSACSSRGSRSGSASSPAAFAPVRLAFLQLPPRASGLYYRQCAPLTELRSEIRQNQQSQIGPVLPLHAACAVSYDGRTIRSLSRSLLVQTPLPAEVVFGRHATHPLQAGRARMQARKRRVRARRRLGQAAAASRATRRRRPTAWSTTRSNRTRGPPTRGSNRQRTRAARLGTPPRSARSSSSQT